MFFSDDKVEPYVEQALVFQMVEEEQFGLRHLLDLILTLSATS